jgi:hypothetical protein
MQLEQLAVSDRQAGAISMFIAENMPLTVSLRTPSVWVMRL